MIRSAIKIRIFFIFDESVNYFIKFALVVVVMAFIELNAFVKLKKWATTGGQAKVLIRSGAVIVNGVVETRNKKKLVSGDVVEYDGKKFILKAEEIK